MGNLMGIPAGASKPLSEMFDALRTFPEGEPDNHMVLALSVDGPVLLAGPKTRGLIVLETNESVEVDEHATSGIVSNLKENLNSFPVEYLRLPLATLKNLGWNLFNYGAPPSFDVFNFIASQDDNSLLSLVVKKTDPVLGKQLRHVPENTSDELKRLIDISASAFFKGKGDVTLYMDGYEQIPENMRRSDDLLPILMAHAAMEWTPVVVATGYGFAIRLVEDENATFGYRIDAVAASNHVVVSLAVIETTKRLIQGNSLDIGVSVRKLRKWLVRNGYNTNKIDTMIIDY